jgi:large subunit ribosomal protein L13
MKTFSAKANEVLRKWWIIDAKDQILGQVAVKAANLLRGKEKAIYTPHVDTGDFVVVQDGECPGPSGAASGIARRARDPRDDPA